MVKLADIDSEIRTGGKILAVIAVSLLGLFLVISGGQFIRNVFFPAPLAAPDQKFGALPPLSFPAQDDRDLSFQVNTISGVLPQFPSDRMKVYQNKKEAASLTALATARDNLSSVGFDEGETKLGDSIYQWSNSESGSNIQLNILNKDFKISSDFLNQPPAPLSGYGGTVESTYAVTIDFLQGMGIDTQYIDEEKSKVTYLKNQGGTLVEAPSQGDAEFIRLDLFQQDIDDTPVFYPGLTESPMYFIYRTDESDPVMVAAEYSNSIPGNSGEYPIISVDQAFEKLKAGEAYIISDKKSGDVDITDVKSGYYIAPDQEYFMPIVVFLGNNFTAYVNALAQ